MSLRHPQALVAPEPLDFHSSSATHAKDELEGTLVVPGVPEVQPDT